jgi:hypothetical protein
MKKPFLIAIVIAGIASAVINRAEACTIKLPTFELTGFPISGHQVAVLGSAQVVESAVTPTLVLAGMPASPHQIAVLTPRRKTLKLAEASVDLSLLTVDVTKPSSQKSTGQALCAPE